MNFPIVNIYEKCWLGEDNWYGSQKDRLAITCWVKAIILFKVISKFFYLLRMKQVQKYFSPIHPQDSRTQKSNSVFRFSYKLCGFLIESNWYLINSFHKIFTPLLSFHNFRITNIGLKNHFNKIFWMILYIYRKSKKDKYNFFTNSFKDTYEFLCIINAFRCRISI